MIMDIFKRLNSISHTAYYSDNHEYVMWKNQDREKKLYTIKESGEKFDIFGFDDGRLAEGMTVDRVVRFLEADLGVASPMKIDVIEVNNSESEIENIISAAARRHGTGSAGVSLLQDLAGRKAINQRTSGMVKKKRKITMEDLED